MSADTQEILDCSALDGRTGGDENIAGQRISEKED